MYCDLALHWLQARFTARESGDYLEGPIWTQQDTNFQSIVMGSFQ